LTLNSNNSYSYQFYKNTNNGIPLFIIKTNINNIEDHITLELINGEFIGFKTCFQAHTDLVIKYLVENMVIEIVNIATYNKIDYDGSKLNYKVYHLRLTSFRKLEFL